MKLRTSPRESRRAALTPEQRLEALPDLTIEQRSTLESLLRAVEKIELDHPDIPEPTTGIEGVRLAQEILEKHKTIGVLIGGILRESWTEGTSVETLSEHKDVDIMLMNVGDFRPERFQGGLDWWVPKVDHEASYGPYFKWVNGNGAVLKFGIDLGLELKPGLYVPPPDAYIDMKQIEALDLLDDGSGQKQVDDFVIKVFRKILRNRMKGDLQHEVGKSVAGQVRDAWLIENAPARGVHH